MSSESEPPVEKTKIVAWVGWRRAKGARWKPVSEGQTESEAFKKLLEIADQGGSGSFDSIVLPAGRKP
jgi:hypothetical protein